MCTSFALLQLQLPLKEKTAVCCGLAAAARRQRGREGRGGEDKIAGSFSELSLSGGLAKRCGQRDRTELQVKQNKTSSSYSIVDSANAVKDRQTEGETDGRQIER